MSHVETYSWNDTITAQEAVFVGANDIDSVVEALLGHNDNFVFGDPLRQYAKQYISLYPLDNMTGEEYIALHQDSFIDYAKECIANVNNNLLDEIDPYNDMGASDINMDTLLEGERRRYRRLRSF